MESWSARKGIERRLSRMFGPDDRSLIIAADHRQRGLQAGMESFGGLLKSIFDVLSHVDSIVTTREPMGSLIHGYPHGTSGKGLLLSLNRTGLSGSVFEMDDRPVATPDLAARWGLDGAKLLVRIDPDSPETNSQLEMCAGVCGSCDRLQLPLIVEPLYCRSEGDGIRIDRSPDSVRYAAIIAADFGVPALKIPYPSGPSRAACRASLGDIVESVSSRVLVLGGEKTSLTDFLTRTEDAIAAGASGLVIGRNVLLDERPALVACALKHIVHGEEGAKEALELARAEVSK